MEIFAVIFGAFVLLGLLGVFLEKRDKGKATDKLEELTSKHNITVAFVSQGGVILLFAMKEAR